MRIYELTPYRRTGIYQEIKPVRTDYIRDINRKLKKLGYVQDEQVLGQGVSGIVYKRAGDPYVIKVFQEDPAYKNYLEYVMQNQDNPHVPRIRGKLIKPYRDVELYLIRMEPLNPLDVYSQQYKLFNDFRDYAFHPTEEFKNNYPDLARILDDIKTLGKNWGKKIIFDLHDENVMVRPTDNTLVVTDPVV